jgi:hypothetical protein
MKLRKLREEGLERLNRQKSTRFSEMLMLNWLGCCILAAEKLPFTLCSGNPGDLWTGLGTRPRYPTNTPMTRITYSSNPLPVMGKKTWSECYDSSVWGGYSLFSSIPSYRQSTDIMVVETYL